MATRPRHAGIREGKKGRPCANTLVRGKKKDLDQGNKREKKD